VKPFRWILPVLAWLMVLPLWPEQTLIPPRPVVWKDFLGVNAHLLWFTPGQRAAQLEKLQVLGLEWVRVDLHWDRHEASEGQFQFKPIDEVVGTLKERRLKSVFYLVGSAPFASSVPLFLGNKDQWPPKDARVFADRLAVLAKRYPSVDAWQVWNEPNLPGFWRPFGSADGYGRLLQASVQTLRREVPGKTIVMAGMAYFSQTPVRGGLMLEELGKMGAFGLGVVVAYHPYSLHPEGDDPKAMDFVLRAQELNRRLREAKVAGIWATEWGWSSYAGPVEEQPVIGADGQADYLLRRLVLMSALDYDRVFLFALSDLDKRAGLRDRSYGLLDLSGNPKPAYEALARFLAICGPRIVPAHGPGILKEAKGQISVSWEKPDGTKLWMFWAGEPGTIELSGIHTAKLHQPLDGRSQSLQVDDGKLRLQATKQLQILEWR